MKKLLLAALMLPAIAFAKPSLEQQALDAMKRATTFMMDSVSYNGGFVWQYLPDFSRQWGEMEATRTMAWVQSPGTPGMGHLLLDVYHATGDEFYYSAAEKVTNALIWGQHPSGGWNYVFDFAGEAALKKWYETVGHAGWRLEEFQHYYGNATFDDAGTMEAANLLLRMYVEKFDPKFKPALDKAIDFVLDAQYPVGLWPQRYPLMYEYSKNGNADYSSYITLNDDVAAQNIDFLIRCYQALGLQGVLEPINRAMNALRILQQGEPLAGWELQYDLMLRPAGARSYEPNGISAPATTGAIANLMDYYRLTGDTKYLMGIPAAIDFLASIALPASELAKIGRDNLPEGTIIVPRVVEIGTGLPRYIHRSGSNVYNGKYFWNRDITHTVSHYSSLATVNIKALREQYQTLLDTPAAELTKGSPLMEKGLVELPKYFTRARGAAPSAQDVQKIVGDLNRRGYWPTLLRTTSNPYLAPEDPANVPVAPGDHASFNVGDKYDTSPYPASEPVEGISAQSYIANMFALARFIESN